MIDTTKQEAKTPRRGFLAAGARIVAGLLAAGAALPLVGCFFSSKDDKDAWLEIMPIDILKENWPLEKTYSEHRQDGIEDETSKTVFVIKPPEGAIYALSSVCPHQHCGVEWNFKENRFICPCHEGQFDITGKVLEGPPTTDLSRVDIKIEGGHLYVKKG
jgi:Rieske Fe-S protein